MPRFRLFLYLSVLTSISLPAIALEDGRVITIDLSAVNKSQDVIKQREVISGWSRIHLENVSDIGFFIIQVHSFATPVHLIKVNATEDDLGVNGTNIGLVQMTTETEFDFYIAGANHTHILIVIVGYEMSDPIPGACSFNSNAKIAPYQQISFSDALIQIDAQPPRADNLSLCEEDNIIIEVYHMYLKQLDFSMESYFDSIEGMLTANDIVKNGRKVESTLELPVMRVRRYFVAYQGVGAIYGIIVKYQGFSSAYIPAVSYGCDVRDISSCKGPQSTSWAVITYLMLLYGLFLCYKGYIFFPFSLLCTGFIVAAILTNIVISYMNLTNWEVLITWAIVGVIYGGLWFVIWQKFKIPTVFVTLTYLVTGVITGGIFFYSGPADLTFFRNDVNFWSVLIGIILLITVILLTISNWLSNIFVTSFIGTYIFIIPIELYIGGTLRYIILNIIHRATIADFRLAVVEPPYQDPIPGACNLTFETEIAPYQKISYSDALIRVDAQPPRLDDLFMCGKDNITIDVYHMYLEEQDFSMESYFDGIEGMLTPNDTIKNGRKVERPLGLPLMRRYFVTYQGVGTIYGIIAKYQGFSSAYIPAVSYGCDVRDTDSCSGPLTTCWKVICGFMVFYGLFLCYMGHRFFQLNLFCTGFIVAAILTYIVISYTNLTDWEVLITLAIVGVVYGGLWLVIWWKFKIPILSVTLTYFVAGVLIGGIFFYSGPADLNLFRNDVNFWSMLIGISLLITILLLVISHWPSNIIATSFIGAYIFIIPFDLYFGGTLRYIVLNIIHRATVANFRLAIVDPPYQAVEVTLIISMVLVVLLGMYVQWRHVRGRAPFPPANALDRGSVFMRLHYNEQPATRASENTPLLSEIDPNPNNRYYHRM